MLFNGEAIFGVVDFSCHAGTGKTKAEALVERARDLGTRAQYRVSGSTILGIALKPADGHQWPVACENADVDALVMGEFYDRRQAGKLLRRDPERSRFLADGYRSKGASFFQCLDGTFAAAVWDRSEERLVLLCDWRADARLYFQLDGDLLVFSSWLQLLAGPLGVIDRRAVEEFLRFLYIAPPRTIYDGISCLEAGHYLTASHGAIVSHALPIVTLDANENLPGENFDRTLDRFAELFQDAVRRRIGQRRVGMFLSSGVDSATLTAVCQSVNPGGVEAFTVGFADAALDESNTAHAMAHHIGVPHTELKFDLSQYRWAFDLMVQGFDQPFADPAGLPLILACESAKDRVDMISGGVGGDDLFGTPMPRHLWFSTAISAKFPPYLRNGIAASLRQLPFAKISNYAALFDFDDAEELFVTWSGWSKRELAELMDETVNFSESGFYRAFRAHQGEGMQELYNALGFFPPDDCRFEAAALVNLPVEFPYHDAHLNSYVRNLPERYRYSDGHTKILLRNLFNRYFPERLLSGKKHYFNIPLQALLAESNYAMVKHYLSADWINRVGLVDSSRATPWIERFVAGDESLRFKVWAVLVLHAWLGSRS